MHHDVNANAAFPTSPIRLSPYATSVMRIDGPPGFALNVTHHAGGPVQVAPIDHTGERTRRATTLREGDRKTVRELSEVTLVGSSDAYVTLSRHEDDQSRGREGITREPKVAATPAAEPIEDVQEEVA
jgi:hypothetical protein